MRLTIRWAAFVAAAALPLTVAQGPAGADSRWIRLIQEASTSLKVGLLARLGTKARTWSRWFRRLKRPPAQGGKELHEWGAATRRALVKLWRQAVKPNWGARKTEGCDGEGCRRKSLMVRLYEPFDPELQTRVDAKGIIRVDHTRTAQANRSAARSKRRSVRSLRAALKDLKKKRAPRRVRRRLRRRIRKLKVAIGQDRLEAAYHGLLSAVNKAVGRE